MMKDVDQSLEGGSESLRARMHIWMVFGACRLPRTPWAGPTSHSECQVEGLKGPERNGGERKIIAFEGLNVSLSQIFLSLPHSLSH